MIVGLGADLVNIIRVEKILSKYGEKFKSRVFTCSEITLADARKDPADSYAKRWAAKEACAKALGTGLQMGISWKEISIVSLNSGQPKLTVSGKAKARLINITPFGYESHILVTLTDDYPWAHATVIIDANLKNESKRNK